MNNEYFSPLIALALQLEGEGQFNTRKHNCKPRKITAFRLVAARPARGIWATAT